MTLIICLLGEKTQFLLQDARSVEELIEQVRNGEWSPPEYSGEHQPGGWQTLPIGEEILLVFPQKHPSAAALPPAGPPLTPRQRAILHLLSEGLTVKQIAGRLGLSRRTVFLHLAAIRQKAGASSTIQAVWKIRSRERP